MHGMEQTISCFWTYPLRISSGKKLINNITKLKRGSDIYFQN